MGLEGYAVKNPLSCKMLLSGNTDEKYLEFEPELLGSSAPVTSMRLSPLQTRVELNDW